ncbi:MAG TPA: tripartite tricarboxylate transporter substrate binding protein [Afifellaceae bacterium]|nr:tripartite tricarboxylate transporter substrate binding protein [Afifellaceae bacterium]
MIKTLSRRAIMAAPLAAALTLGVALPGALAEYPDKPVRIIVPTQAGGGMDTVARILQKYNDETNFIGNKIVVINKPGAGGTIATRTIAESDSDGYTIGFWHEGLITSKVMGVVDYDHTAFEVLGATGYGELGLGVSKDSAIKSFQDLIDNAKATPESVKVATNVGLPVHFVPLMVEKAAGVQFKFVQVGGGAKRFPSVVAKHTDTAIFGASEFIKWADADLVPVVMFSEKRLDLLPDVPTARELGFDVLARANRIWLAPKGTPKEITEHISSALKTAMADPQVKKQFEELGLIPDFVAPDTLKAELDDWKARAEPLVDKAMELKK